jgi:hypothetical protein
LKVHTDVILVEFEEAQHATDQYQPILLSSAVASGAKDSRPKSALSAASGSSMAIRNFSKNLDGMIFVPVDPAVDFKNCCLATGIYDGELRNYFFQRMKQDRGRINSAPSNQ